MTVSPFVFDGVIQLGETVVTIEPWNSDAVRMQIHVDGEYQVDVHLGRGILLEGVLLSKQMDVTISLRELREVIMAGVHGRVVEKLRGHGGEVGRSKGAVDIGHKVLHSSRYDLTAGWLWGTSEEIRYRPYQAGSIVLLDERQG